jgi:outer membrane protein assembly factor BamA
MSYRDQDAGIFTFDRYEAEAAHFVPLADRRVVFAFHGWTAISNVADDRDIPVYLMPSLGGKNTLRAYSDFRFHDRNIAVITAESRFAVFTHIDVAAFFDAGNVAHRAADLNFDKHDYGVGIRLHNLHSTLARLDIARGDGGWKFAFSTNDPLHLTRVRKSTAMAPFVP